MERRELGVARASATPSSELIPRNSSVPEDDEKRRREIGFSGSGNYSIKLRVREIKEFFFSVDC